MNKTTLKKLGRAHAPPAPQDVHDEANRAFESWFTDLRLDDKEGALFAKVPKKILQKVFRIGFQNGGYRHWSTLTKPQAMALARFYAPQATVRTPEDIKRSCAILEALERDVRKRATEEAMQRLTLARQLADVRGLLYGVQEAEPDRTTTAGVEGPTGELRWTQITDHGPGTGDREQHGPGWEDHGQG